MNFLFLKKAIVGLNRIIIFVFCYENGLTYLVHVSHKTFKNCMDLLVVTNKNKSDYGYIKDFNRFMCNKTKCKVKKHFCRYCLQFFSSEREHKEVFLKINGKQTVKLRSGSIKFKNHFKQLAVPFKIYADFKCNMKRVKSSDKNNNTSYTKKYQDHIPNSFDYKTVCVDNKFSKQVVLSRGKNTVYKFIDAAFKEYNYYIKVIKKHFNRNLIMYAEDEERFQLSNKCWIYDKLCDEEDNKVRDHCHITGKYRASAHWSCNVNLGLTKIVPVIFNNLRGYDSHFIMQEIGRFDVKINVIPNGLEKCTAFKINNNLVFINSMQFANSSLDELVKKLSENDFKYLSQEFSGDLFELEKQKGVYAYEYMDSFEDFSEDKLPDRCKVYSSLNGGCISEKDYLYAVKV